MSRSVPRTHPAFRLEAYVLSVSVTGTAVLVLAVLLGGGQLVDHGDASVVCLGLLAILGEFVRIRVFRRRAEGEITLSTAFSFAVLLSGGPLAACAVLGLASLAADVHARKGPLRAWFNVAQYVISMAAAGAVLGVLSDVPHAGQPLAAGDLPAVLLSGVTFFAVNSVLVAVVIALAHGYSVVSYFRADFMFVAASAGVALALAPIAVLAAAFSPVLAPALALPLLAVHRGARQAMELEHHSLHDALTGLPNRVLLRQRVEHAIAAGAAHGERVAVLLLDLDHFKEINDTLGHLHGDLLLREVAARLASDVRDGDTVARLGGDEFAIVLAPVASSAEAVALAERIRERLDAPIDIDGVVLRTEASVGVAIAPDDGDDVETVLRRADIAMYVAKGGRTGIEVYDAAQERHSPARLALAGELRRALDEEQLEVWFQPQAALADGRVTGVEALVRWQHPAHGVVGPDAFVPLAENTGLIGPMTAGVLEDAMTQVRAWDVLGMRLDLAVNLSTRSLADRRLATSIGELLERHGMAPHRLELEITESMIAADPERALAVLADLRALGVRLALDDFGTGYSSLANLRDLPVDRLKIDRTFTQRLTVSHPDRVIVTSTVELAHRLGLRVVAEGVESREAWECLRAMDCDLAQGYWLAQPMSAAHATAWLSGRRELEAGEGLARAC